MIIPGALSPSPRQWSTDEAPGAAWAQPSPCPCPQPLLPPPPWLPLHLGEERAVRAPARPLRSRTVPRPANAPGPLRLAHCCGWGPQVEGHRPGCAARESQRHAQPAYTARLWPGRLYIRRVGSARSSDLPAHRPGAGRAGGGAWTGRGSGGHVGSSGLPVRWCAAPRQPHPTPPSACPPGAVRPNTVRQGLPEASRPLGTGIWDGKAGLSLCLLLPTASGASSGPIRHPWPSSPVSP